MRLLVTRPEEDATALKAQLTARGHEVVVEPLLRVELLAIDAADVAGAQALIATSRNGLRALARSAAMGEARGLPVFAVGPGTSATAKALGFQIVIQGPRSARELVPVIGAVAEVNGGPLVHLAGDKLAFDLAAPLQRLGFHVHQPVVYTTTPVGALSPSAIRAIDGGRIDGVILLSPQTADIYCRLVRRHGLDHANERVIHFCLSAAVAARVADLRPSRLMVADGPNLEEMLALIGSGAAQ